MQTKYDQTFRLFEPLAKHSHIWAARLCCAVFSCSRRAVG